MSLFGSLEEDDSLFGLHMRSLRQMNNMMNSMNSMMTDPFGGLFRGLEAIGPSPLTAQMNMNNRHSLMPFNFPDINQNRLLGGGGNYYQQPDGGMSFSSSSYVSMTRGPDGRPQIYKATSSSKSGPGGIRETKKTVQDSRTGVSKMAIGQHIGERAHVVERQKNAHTGEEEETVDLINVDETEADEFNREFERKARDGVVSQRPRQYQQLAIAAPPSSSIDTSKSKTSPTTTSTTTNTHQQQQQQYLPSNRRGIRNIYATPRRHLRTPTSSILVIPSASTYSTSPHPYNQTARRQYRQMKSHSHPHYQQQQQTQQPQQQQQQPHQQPPPQHHVHQVDQQQQQQQYQNNSTSGPR